MGVKEYQPFPVDVLPEPLRTFVGNTASEMGCDAGMVALPTLVGMAAAVGTTRQLEIKPGWREASVLWGMVISRRGSKKSPALRRALRPIYEMQARAGQPGSNAAASVPKDPDDSADSERPCQLASLSVPNHLQRIMTNDVSIAALADILGTEPRGILVVRDELTGWLGDLRKHPSRSDMSQWLSAWSAETWILDRHGRDRIVIPSAAVSVIGGIQPQVLPKVVTATDLDAGLLDRFLYVVPPAPPADRWSDACEDAEDRRMMEILFAQLYRITDKGTLQLERRAKEQFVEFYNTNGQRAADAEGAMACMLSKFRSHVARLAMTLQLARWAVGDAPQDPVDGISMKAANDLGDWFAGQASRALDLIADNVGSAAGSAGRSDEEVVLTSLRQIGGSGTVRDVQRSTGRRFQKAQQVEDILERLSTEGRVQRVQDTRTGRGPKATRYKLPR